MTSQAPIPKSHWSLVGHWLVVIATFLAMLGWSWFTWPDPLVDFGRELYVPWQIVAGKVLYRDIAYFNGPLSPYFNAAVFAILGVSLRSIVIINTLLLAGLVAMVWMLFRKLADAFAATVACVVLLTVFSFIQLGGVGNYNFITPYSHEITHGVILSFAAILCLGKYLAEQRRELWAFVLGFVLGLIFLTKVEVFVAIFFAMLIGVLLSKPTAKVLGGLMSGMILPPVVTFLLLCLVMPTGEALRGTLGSWAYAFNREITGLPFYRQILGTTDLTGSIQTILKVTGVYCVILAIGISLAFLVKSHRRTIILIIVIASLAAGFAFYHYRVNLGVWQGSLRGLTIVSPLIAIWMTLLAVRNRNPDAIIRCVISVFAAVLLAKIFFNVLAYHYGFALAMPATLVAIAAVMGWLPNELDRRGQFGCAVRSVAMPAIGLFVFVYLFVFGTMYVKKAGMLGQGPDAFYSDRRGYPVDVMLQFLAQLPREAMVAVVPEGVMINYLSGRPNPTPFINLMPPEVLMFGQERILRSFSEHPPDYIIINRLADPKEYGFKDFGEYAPGISNWIEANYVEANLNLSPNFEFRLLRKR